ncbi:MAG: dihydropteroate synthase, partial [Clostridia bacterium]|nr:dihydropteroate synthase [Clostridia bacterium]
MFKAGSYTMPLGSKTYIMGILNYTPDSFSDGGRYFTTEKALEQALLMEKQGADIIDLGANSTRPGATILSDKDELKRLEE